jgi:hypothetical protein
MNRPVGLSRGVKLTGPLRGQRSAGADGFPLFPRICLVHLTTLRCGGLLSARTRVWGGEPMGVSAPRVSRAWVRTFLALVVGILLSAGLASFASSSGNTNTTTTPDGGPQAPLPPGACNPEFEPCILPSGCPGEKICNGHGGYGNCICAGGGGTAPCSSCGFAENAVCSSSCTPGACPVPPPQGCQGSAGCTGTQTCNPGATQWNPCSNCSGTTSCTTTCGGNPGTGACSATTCAFGGGFCTPPAEVCNGKDDDCNGLVDDGITCGACDSL